MDMDPFEARLEFTGLLSRLNASQHSIQKVGNFAMKNRDMYEDLYNCITEELEKTSINARMNILYVLDSISQQSKKAGFTGYIDLIQRNLPQIIESIAPVGPKGNVNVAGTKKVLDSWRTKRLYHESAIAKVERPLLARELGANAPATSETGLSKDDILRRMDEDRERHKRIREDIWIRAPEEDPAAEFSQQWNEVPDFEEADFEEMVDENDKYLPGYQWEVEFEAVPLRETPLKDIKTNGSEYSAAAGAVLTAESRPQSTGPPPPPPPLPPQLPRLSPSVLEAPSPPVASEARTPVERVVPTGPAVPEASPTSQSVHPPQGQGQGQAPGGGGDRPVYSNDRKRPYAPYPQHHHPNSSHQQDSGHERDDYSHSSKRIHPFDHGHHQHLHHRHHHRQTSSGSVASSSTVSGTLTPFSASGTPTSSSSSTAAAAITATTVPASATHTASHPDAPPRREGYLTTDDREPSRYDRHIGLSSAHRQGRVEDRFYHHSERFDPPERSLEEREGGRDPSTAGAGSTLGMTSSSVATSGPAAADRRSDVGHGADLDRDRGRDRDSDRGGLHTRSSLSHRDYDRDRNRDRDHYRDHRDPAPHRSGRYNPSYHQSHHHHHYQRDAREEHDLRDRTPRDRDHDTRDRAPRERDEPLGQPYRHGGDQRDPRDQRDQRPPPDRDDEHPDSRSQW